MPAIRTLLVLALLLVLPISALTATALTDQTYQNSEMAESSLTKALTWLANNQQVDGSYGSYSQLQTAPAAYALWLNDSSSVKAQASYSWLASEFDDENSGIWSEAGTPGEILYTLVSSDNLGLLTKSSDDYNRLRAFQQASGGFKGFWAQIDGEYVQVETSVDTAMALWGLINIQEISTSDQAAAVDYLLQLQNNDGSFNLTSTIKSSEFSSLGPEPVSMTALVTLLLGTASYSADDPAVSKALGYLGQATTRDFDGHVYAAALSALVFGNFDRSEDASKALSFIRSSQNDDGGFRDRIRSSAGSNALDTGWTAVALKLVESAPEPEPEPEPAPSPPSQPSSPSALVLAMLVSSIVVPTSIITGVAVYFRIRKKRGS